MTCQCVTSWDYTKVGISQCLNSIDGKIIILSLAVHKTPPLNNSWPITPELLRPVKAWSKLTLRIIWLEFTSILYVQRMNKTLASSSKANLWPFTWSLNVVNFDQQSHSQNQKQSWFVYLVPQLVCSSDFLVFFCHSALTANLPVFACVMVFKHLILPQPSLVFLQPFQNQTQEQKMN